MKLLLILFFTLTAPIANAGLFCNKGNYVSPSEVFTLYRNSGLDENMRIHVATFDAKDGRKYNKENCEVSARLFKKPMVIPVYWCELGYFKK